MDDFTPTSYDEDTDTEISYRQGFPFAMRDQGSHNPDDMLLVVLGDMADCAEDAGLPCAADLRREYGQAVPALRAAKSELSEYGADLYYATVDHLNTLTFYPPDGLVVDWNGEAGTVTTTLTAGWPSPTDHFDCDKCHTNHPADQHCDPA